MHVFYIVAMAFIVFMAALPFLAIVGCLVIGAPLMMLLNLINKIIAKLR